MIHPFFTKLVSQPGLFAEHAGAYAELASAEVRHFAAVWRRRLVLVIATAIAAMLAIGISAVAGMLGAVIPWESMPAPWILVAVPGAFWIVALLCGFAAWRIQAEPMFSVLREQMAVDIDLLNRAGKQT